MGNDTLKELFKVGAGPSSSHTIGPERATKRVKEKFPDADSFVVELWEYVEECEKVLLFGNI